MPRHAVGFNELAPVLGIQHVKSVQSADFPQILLVRRSYEYEFPAFGQKLLVLVDVAGVYYAILFSEFYEVSDEIARLASAGGLRRMLLDIRPYKVF